MGMMINRRRVMGGKKLPYDAEIEYLEGDGNAYIDTGILPFSDIGFYFIFAAKSKTSGNSVVFGCTENGAYNNGKGVGFDTTQKYFYYGNLLTAYSPLIQLNIPYTISMNYKNNSLITIDDWSQQLNKGTAFTTRKTITINRWNNGDLYGNKNGIFYKFIITNKERCIFDAIPVRVGTTGYMYDKVSKQLFGNAGTGAFILGPDK